MEGVAKELGGGINQVQVAFGQSVMDQPDVLETRSPPFDLLVKADTEMVKLPRCGRCFLSSRFIRLSPPSRRGVHRRGRLRAC